MATAKVMIILLMLTVVLTTSTVLTSALARPSDTTAVVASLLRLATAVSWVVLTVIWVGNRIMDKIEEARNDALIEIAAFQERWKDKLLATELEHRIGRAEDGSSSSIDWINKRRST